ncbi:MAG: c-type cytochrome [Alphaproteobacteria bacterium]|nr:c-type cytochrome [Alphaproteobacteria bacterium]
MRAARGILLPLFLLAAPAAADMSGHGGMVRALAISPDGNRVLSGSFDYTARLWDFSDQSQIAELNEHFGPINSVAYAPGGASVATASDDGTAIVWDVAAKTPRFTLRGHDGKVMAVAFSPDGALIATGGWDRTVRLWDAGTGSPLRTLEHPADLTALRFTGDGRLIAGARDGALRVWRTRDGVQTGEMKGHDWVVTQIAVSPDGSRVLSAGTDGTVRLWDMAALTELAALRGHEGPVSGVAFSPDGLGAISGGSDGAIVLWDLAKRAQRRAILTHVKPVWAVAFSHDGRFGLSAGSDGVIRVWHLETGDRIGIPGEGDGEPKPWLESDHPGARLYRKCANCHSLTADGPRRSGPHFAGLFGRQAGSVDGYKYSRTLRGADFTWNDETLFALFSKGPDVFLPGTKMPVQRIPQDDQLRRLIDYMRTLTGSAGRGGRP